MPTPGENEGEQDFVSRCIPIVLEEGTAEDQEQAAAICYSIYRREKAMTDELVVMGGAVKLLGDNRVGGYLIRYSSPREPDLEGDFFSKTTEFGIMDGAGLPIFYQHGFDAHFKSRVIGRGTIKFDDFGLWCEAQLDIRDEYEQFLLDLTKQGKLGYSSGAAGHLVEREQVGKAWHVKTWIIAEGSLTPTPAEPKNAVMPLKSFLGDIKPKPQPEQIAEAEQTAQEVTAEDTDKPIKGVNEMEITEEKLQELLDTAAIKAVKDVAEDAADKAVKAFAQTLPTKDEGGVQVEHDEADTQFLSIAEQCRAIKSITTSYGRNRDPRLSRLEVKAAPTGANETVPAEGGFLLEPTLTSELLVPLHEEGPFSRMARRLPVSANSISGWINGVDETSRATGSRWGGIQGYRIAEGGTITASQPKFKRLNWELKKYVAAVYATDELLADAAQFSAIAQQGCREELSFMANDDILNGVGTSGALGILQGGALISVSAETNQAADTVVWENLVNMWSRMDIRARRNATWFYNTELEPQLFALALPVGTAALEPRFITYGPDGILRAFGRPMVVTEFNAGAGDLGDILLADMTQYLMWEKEVQGASSIHVAFMTDQTVFRFIARLDGRPALDSPVTAYKATTATTHSPFVALAAR